MCILNIGNQNNWSKLLLVVVAVLSIAGCDKRKFEVTDNSELKSISITGSDTTAMWQIGTSRIFEIMCDPPYARVRNYELKSSDSDVLSIIRNSERTFEVTATGEGLATITAVADDQTAEKEFSVYDDSIKKEDLGVELHISTITDQADKSVMDENTRLDAEVRYHLTASSICNNPKYSLKSWDEDVVSIEWDENGSWIIYAKNPGRCSITLNVSIDPDTTFDYRYDIIVYGHIKFTALFSVPDYIGGFKVDEYDYPISKADVYLSAIISGYPWDDKNDVIERTVSPVSGTYELYSGIEYPSIIETGDEADEINSMYKMDGNEKIWYGVHAIQMDFIVKLDNPYIIIDDIIDDSDRDSPIYVNFEICSSLQQEGLASFEEKTT